MQEINRIKPKLKILGLLLGSALLLGGPLAWGDADDSGTSPYGPGMMWRYQTPPGGNANGGYAYGPGMMRGYGGGYGYGPGMMQGYGGGPGMMWGQGWGGYGPGMMQGHGGGYGYGPGMMQGYGGGPGMMWGQGWGGYGPGMMQGHGGGYGYGPGMMQGYGGGPEMMWGQGWGGYGPGMMAGWGAYGPGAMQGYGGWRGAPLQLTDQQRQRLDAIHAKAAKALWPLLGQMQEQRFALARLLAGDNPDKKAVDDAYNKLSQTGRQLLDLRLETRRDAWSVLTAAQIKQLRQYRMPAQ